MHGVAPWLVHATCIKATIILHHDSLYHFLVGTGSCCKKGAVLETKYVIMIEYYKPKPGNAMTMV